MSVRGFRALGSGVVKKGETQGKTGSRWVSVYVESHEKNINMLGSRQIPASLRPGHVSVSKRLRRFPSRSVRWQLDEFFGSMHRGADFNQVSPRVVWIGGNWI